jgi:putative Mg2+ transporter-C (MgtC) family protein
VELLDFDWSIFLTDLLRIAVAFTLALPTAWENTRHARRLGIRTFPIVAVASCGYMLIVNYVPDITAEGQARAVQGLMTGIGFIGGGAILKQRGTVYGLSTAASIWNTGAIGAAVAFNRGEIALLLSLINFLLLRLLRPIARIKGTGEEENGGRSAGPPK